MIRQYLEKFSAEHPIRLGLLVFFLAFVVVVSLSLGFYGIEFYENILVEAHGVLFDLLVIGVFVFWLQSLGERRRTIQRYQEEIEDYLGWNEPEAMYRIVGNIRRLNREGVFKIALRNANLQNATLQYARLQNADFQNANLQNADLYRANLREANLWYADLQQADLRAADLQRADLRNANLQNADVKMANLRQANLLAANLQSAHLQEADLQQADIGYANLQKTNLEYANLRNANLQNATYNDYTTFPEDFDPVKAGAIYEPKDD